MRRAWSTFRWNLEVNFREKRRKMGEGLCWSPNSALLWSVGYVSTASMKSEGCYYCQKPNATFDCRICHEVLCKKCVQFINSEDFTFYVEMPEPLKSEQFCPSCFTSKIEPEIEKYNSTMELAENVDVFLIDQGKESRLIKPSKLVAKVVDCPDRAETLLRLAFQAALAGYNTLIDVDITSKKVRENAYQKQIWSGTGIPAQVEKRRRNT